MSRPTKFPEVYAAVIPIITQFPGITTIDLATKLQEQFNLPRKLCEGVIHNMLYRDDFVHVQASDNNRATYKCYMTVPPGIEPYRFKLRSETSKASIERQAREQRKRERAQQKQERANALVAKQKMVAAQAAVVAFREAHPKVVEVWNQHATAHPKLKPFVPTINIEDRDGRLMTLTLEEARRMYEQLSAHFNYVPR